MAVLENGGIFADENWYWIGAGALLAYTIITNVLFTLLLTYLKGKRSKLTVINVAYISFFYVF